MAQVSLHITNAESIIHKLILMAITESNVPLLLRHGLGPVRKGLTHFCLHVLTIQASTK